MVWYLLLKKYPKSSSEKSLMTAPLIKRQLPNEMICDPFGPMKLIYTLKNPLLLPSLKIKVVSIFIFFSKSQDIFCPIRLFNINSFNTEKIGSSLERNLYDFNCSFSSKTSACSRVRKKLFFLKMSRNKSSSSCRLVVCA